MGRCWTTAAVLAAVLAALATASSVGAAGGQDRVSGAAIQTLGSEITGGAPEHDQYAVGATADADGSNPSGSIEYSSDAPGLPQQHFHGDVSQGCVIVNGNTATVVGILPPSEQFIDPVSGRLIDGVAVFVQDNGNPVQGQPVDQAVSTLLFSSSVANVCAGAPPPSGFLPIEHGNFVVNDAS